MCIFIFPRLWKCLYHFVFTSATRVFLFSSCFQYYSVSDFTIQGYNRKGYFSISLSFSFVFPWCKTDNFFMCVDNLSLSLGSVYPSLLPFFPYFLLLIWRNYWHILGIIFTVSVLFYHCKYLPSLWLNILLYDILCNAEIFVSK